MRELAVFYCPKCGHYAYYQTSRHPQCPKCGCEEAMYMVRMHYTEFMRMSCDERDEFLSKEILKTNPSLVERLTAPHKRYNSREIIAEMNNVIMNLDTENKILNDTVKWMHDTIWDLMHESGRWPGMKQRLQMWGMGLRLRIARMGLMNKKQQKFSNFLYQLYK